MDTKEQKVKLISVNIQQAWAIMSAVHILFWLHILTRVINRHASFEYIVLETRYIHTFSFAESLLSCSSTNFNNRTCTIKRQLLFNKVRHKAGTKISPISAHFSKSCHQKLRETNTHTASTYRIIWVHLTACRILKPRHPKYEPGVLPFGPLSWYQRLESDNKFEKFLIQIILGGSSTHKHCVLLS